MKETVKIIHSQLIPIHQPQDSRAPEPATKIAAYWDNLNNSGARPRRCIGLIFRYRLHDLPASSLSMDSFTMTSEMQQIILRGAAILFSRKTYMTSAGNNLNYSYHTCMNSRY